LSTDCYIIGNIKTYMSALALQIIYHAYVHSAICYRIIFWGNMSQCSTVFSLQKKVIRIMEGCENSVVCRNLLKKL
jgi:hypothetical protein